MYLSRSSALRAASALYISGQAVVRFPLLVDEEADGPHVRCRSRAGCSRAGLAVPPGAARLLIVALQILGHVVVDDEPDVGLVDAHAEGVGGHHDADPVVEEIVLIVPCASSGSSPAW